MSNIVHHHLIYQAKVGSNLDVSEETLKQFLCDLLELLNMSCLIPATVKLSHQKAWTGMVGIITSHIAFHFWTIEKYVQLDIYSCKEFDKHKAIKFIDNFFKSKDTKAIFIDREIGKNLNINIVK